jgi:hypothetical protein
MLAMLRLETTDRNGIGYSDARPNEVAARLPLLRCIGDNE